MKRKRNSSLTDVKSRKSSISSRSNSDGVSDELHCSTKTSSQQKEFETAFESNQEVDGNDLNITVRLQNADMLTRYRKKNPHVKLENSTITSNFIGSEINKEDEVWVCEVPNSIDVNELVGKSVKLGNKKCSIKSEKAKIECMSSKFEGGICENSLSLIFQNKNSRLSLKNLKTVGRMMIHKKIEENHTSAELSPTPQDACILFPDHLVVRHPLFGRQFEDKVQVNEKIKKQLLESQPVDDDSIVQMKEEKEDSKINLKKSHKKTKPNESATGLENMKEKCKTASGHDDDLVRIKQIFEKTH